MAGAASSLARVSLIQEPVQKSACDKDEGYDVHPKEKQGNRCNASIECGEFAKMVHVHVEGKREYSACNCRDYGARQLRNEVPPARGQKRIARRKRDGANSHGG